MGVAEVLVLRFLQHRNKGWIGRQFFAKYDPETIRYFFTECVACR